MTDQPSDRESTGADKPWRLFRSFASYAPAFVTGDLVAGLTLVAIAIPEQMATARLGGFDPQVGFFAFLAGALAFAVFGNNRLLSCGADSTITPIFAGGLAALATLGSPEYFALASTLAVMVGLVLVIGGIFRLGWIADLLSIPVTTGFLAGISAHILISQLPSVLGVPPPDGAMLVRLAHLAGELTNANPFTVVIGFGVLAVITISERTHSGIPGALIGLVAATAAVVLFGLENRGVAVLGAVSGGLPKPEMPALSVAQWGDLVPLSLIIAVVVMVQTAATTRSFSSSSDAPVDIDRDFIGVGAGSLLAGLFGAFAVNASPPRTAIVSETGGKSQLAGLTAAAIIVVLLTVGTGLLRPIPHAALGGVLFFVAFRILRVRQIVAIYRQSLGEFLLVVATTLTIIAMPIEQGVATGIVLSILHGIWSTTRARVILFERVPGTTIWWPASPRIKGETVPCIIVAGFQAPLSFLNAYHFRQDIETALRSATPQARLVVIEATGIVEIDFTAAQVLGDLIRECRHKGIAIALARLESIRAQDAVERFHIDELLGSDHIYRSVDEAIRALGGETVDG